MPRNLSKLIKGGYGNETGYFDISGKLITVLISVPRLFLGLNSKAENQLLSVKIVPTFSLISDK